MSDTIKFIDPDELMILTQTTYLYETIGGEYKYYIGVINESNCACKLSKLYDTERQAVEALEEGFYKTKVIVRKYENGLTLYFPAEN